MKPSIGRIVIYTPNGEWDDAGEDGESAGSVFPAIVTATQGDGLVRLAVFGMWQITSYRDNVPEKSDKHPTGCWSWPEREGSP